MTELELQRYEQVLYQIASRLSDTEAKDIAILNGLEQRFQEDERQFVILVQLERMQLVSEHKPECLVNILKHINRHDLAKESERLNAKLKNKKKKPKQSKQQDRSYSDAVYDCAQFAIARSQIDQLATSLVNLDLDGTEAMVSLKAINKLLSRTEKQNNLPSTENFVSSPFLNCTGDSDSMNSGSSLSPQSSLTGNILVQGQQEERPYEEMTYSGDAQCHPPLPVSTTPQQTVAVETIGIPNMESRTQTMMKPPESFIDFRPPQPAPKPPKKPKLSKTTETISPSQSPGLPKTTPSGTTCPRVPLPGLINTDRPPSSLPTSTTLSPSTRHARASGTADTTGDDSGHGTGSGFSDVRPFLREPMVPKEPIVPKKSLPWNTPGHPPVQKPSASVYPQVSPKPVKYTPLKARSNSVADHGYTSLHQENNTLLQQFLNSANKQ